MNQFGPKTLDLNAYFSDASSVTEPKGKVSRLKYFTSIWFSLMKTGFEIISRSQTKHYNIMNKEKKKIIIIIYVKMNKKKSNK